MSSDEIELMELTYEIEETGEVYKITYPHNDPVIAINQIFKWYWQSDAFTAEILGSFVSVVLQDCIDREKMGVCCWGMLSRILRKVSSSKHVAPGKQINLMQELVVSSIESEE